MRGTVKNLAVESGKERGATRVRQVKEQPALRFAFGRMVGLPVDVVLDILDGREGAGLGENSAASSASARASASIASAVASSSTPSARSFCWKSWIGILGAAVLLDLLLGTVGVVRVGDRVAAVAIGVDFDRAGTMGFRGRG
jgi:hypothetical protein